MKIFRKKATKPQVHIPNGWANRILQIRWHRILWICKQTTLLVWKRCSTHERAGRTHGGMACTV